MARRLYALPENYANLEMREAMEWATDEVLRLDEENQRLRLKLEAYERKGIQTRIAAKDHAAYRYHDPSGPFDRSEPIVIPH